MLLEPWNPTPVLRSHKFNCLSLFILTHGQKVCSTQTNRLLQICYFQVGFQGILGWDIRDYTNNEAVVCFIHSIHRFCWKWWIYRPIWKWRHGATFLIWQHLMQNLVWGFQNAFQMEFKSANAQPALWVDRENTHSTAVLWTDTVKSQRWRMADVLWRPFVVIMTHEMLGLIAAELSFATSSVPAVHLVPRRKKEFK